MAIIFLLSIYWAELYTVNESGKYNIVSNIVYPTCPPQYPDQQEKCKNCGLVKHHRSKTKKWIEYSDEKERAEPSKPITHDGVPV